MEKQPPQSLIWRRLGTQRTKRSIGRLPREDQLRDELFPYTHPHIGWPVREKERRSWPHTGGQLCPGGCSSVHWRDRLIAGRRWRRKSRRELSDEGWVVVKGFRWTESSPFTEGERASQAALWSTSSSQIRKGLSASLSEPVLCRPWERWLIYGGTGILSQGRGWENLNGLCKLRFLNLTS
jgi:hypothetical protein